MKFIELILANTIFKVKFQLSLFSNIIAYQILGNISYAYFYSYFIHFQIIEFLNYLDSKFTSLSLKSYYLVFLFTFAKYSEILLRY